MPPGVATIRTAEVAPDVRGDEACDALASPMEFFAELSEACFSRTDFLPFDRSELEGADPVSARRVRRLWGAPQPMR